jgi:DNA gyrase subunit B
MQGKPMNALRATDGKVATNPFLRALTEAVGAGRGAAFDPSALRYERVVLLMDPDADGIHCGALLLMFFHRWMPLLLENGHLERVHAPVGEVRLAEGGAPAYAYTDAQFQAIGARLRASGATAFTALRYRGLAGLDPSVLVESCVRRETRNGRILGPSDARAAMEVFVSLRALPPHGGEVVRMRIPAAGVVDGDIGHARLDHAPRGQAILAEGVAPVAVAQLRIFLFEVERIAGDGPLHQRRELAGGQFQQGKRGHFDRVIGREAGRQPHRSQQRHAGHITDIHFEVLRAPQHADEP